MELGSKTFLAFSDKKSTTEQETERRGKEGALNLRVKKFTWKVTGWKGLKSFLQLIFNYL